MLNRRQAFVSFIGFTAASPLWAEEDVNQPVNVHEFEAIAKRKLHKIAYDFIAGGAEDERTLPANRQAFGRVFLIPRVMVDVSTVDTSLDLLGTRLDSPILIAPTGGKSLVMPGADEIVATAAAKSATLICSATGAEKLAKAGQVHWWTNTFGHTTRAAAQRFAKGYEDIGAKAIVVTVDNPYWANRDRNTRNQMDLSTMRTGIAKDGKAAPALSPATPAMWRPLTPGMTWQYVEWLRSGSKLPVLLKCVISPEDAKLAVEHGASAIIVSNHGGRQLDGTIATLDALPDVVAAVNGKIPVLMDGGIRRGTDILKALALGATAVLVGRAPLWGLGAFGQAGVERVLWLLKAELKLAMALAGKPNIATIDRSLVRRVDVRPKIMLNP